MGRVVKRALDGEPPKATASEEAAALLAAARAEANRELATAKDAAVVLARRMAERIVGCAVELDESLMRKIAAQALAAVKPSKEAVTLRVHPDDLAALEAARRQWLGELAAQADVRLVADDGVGRYGCVVETAVGWLDARLQTQLDALEAALRAKGIGVGAKD
jgi:flagellar assembly protein FliH